MILLQKINYIVEKGNWSIRMDGQYISESLNNKFKNKIVKVLDFPLLSRESKIVHFDHNICG